MTHTPTELLNLGYMQAKKNPKVFYKRCMSGIVFVRLGWHSTFGSDWYGVRIGYKPFSLRHLNEQDRNTILQQLRLLGINFHISAIHNEIPEWMSLWLGYDICPHCPNSWSDKPKLTDCLTASLVRETRQAVDAFESSPICAACHQHYAEREKTAKHHVTYYPEWIVPVHKQCHTEIH